MKLAAEMPRMLIVFDGKRWFIRQVRVIEHDLERSEKVYRCDQPMGKPRGYTTFEEARHWVDGFLMGMRAGR